MYSLFVLNETYTNGYRVEVLDFISLDSIICGILVIISKNPIVSVLFLIGLFLSISCYLIMLGINFIGLSYLLVYVGAVSILFLFILMLINIRVSELISDTNNNLPLALITIIAFFIPFSNLLPDAKTRFNLMGFEFNKLLQDITNTKQISYVTSKNWDGNLLDSTDIMSIGNIMYTSYSIWLLITSIILLLAMVGSIVITIKQKN